MIVMAKKAKHLVKVEFRLKVNHLHRLIDHQKKTLLENGVYPFHY